MNAITYKKYILALVITIIPATVSATNSEFYRGPIPFLDFDVAMKKSEHEFLLQQSGKTELYNFFKKLYEFTNPSAVLPEQNQRIPKKLHFIWLGRPMPQEYNKYINSWREFHPDWEFKLWTEADLPTFNFKNRDIFDHADNYSRKADIWCLEILEQEGGLYLNIDFQCLKRMDTFHYTYDFYIAMQPLDTNIVQIGTGLIGSAPHHPLLALAIKNIRQTEDITQIIIATGPVFFTRCFIEYIQNHWISNPQLRDFVVLPALYFYPCGYTQRGSSPGIWYNEAAYAVHHWAGSWLGKEAFSSYKQ